MSNNGEVFRVLSFFRKYVFCFIITAMFLFVIPTKTFVSAEDPSYLATLPFDNPIGHNKGYEDFKGQKVVVVFGRITCGNTMLYIPYINSLIEKESLENDINVLFYDVDQAMSAVTSYVNEKGWKNIYTFSGGNREMWQGLRMQGIANSVTFPAVFYLDEQGSITHHSINFQSAKEIKNNVDKALNNSDSNLGEVVRVSVLADAQGMSYESQKAEVTKRLALINQNVTASFTSKPSAKAPYREGELTAEYQNNALAALNLVRYMSGLQPVRLDEQLVSIAQHGAVLMDASNYGHYPVQPSDMSSEFYKIASKGTSEGNIYSGYANLTTAIFHGWMADDSPRNIASVGHRRWALNPKMGATGFGEYNRLGVMYAFDGWDQANSYDYDAVAYPSGAAFPAELFQGSYPWSVAINPDRYKVPDPLKLKVTLENGQKKWSFTLENSQLLGNYMNYDTANYGIPSNIVFRPEDITQYNGTYKVTVEGLENVVGQKAVLQYETTFFSEEKPVSSTKTPIERANELSLVPTELNKDFSKVITRAEFSKLAVMLYEKLNGPITPTITFSDTTNIYVRKAATIGIVSGTGNGKFNPNGELKREHAAKIVDQVAQVLGLPSKTGKLTYADNNKIAEWAKPFVASVGANKLMTGEANNQFNPKGKYTRRQSIVTLMRVYDAVNK